MWLEDMNPRKQSTVDREKKVLEIMRIFAEEGDLEDPISLCNFCARFSLFLFFIFRYDKYFIFFFINEYINCLSCGIRSVGILPLILTPGGSMPGFKISQVAMDLASRG